MDRQCGYENGEIRVVASDPMAASQGSLPVVAQSGVALARLERGRPSLEDIFLRLVGDGRVTEQEATE